AVNRLNLSVFEGEIFGFIGPNGAGKTTTLRMMSGILAPTEGSVTIDGIGLAGEPEKAKQRIGYIPDRPFLYEKLTGMEFLRFTADLFGVEDGLFRGQSESLLNKFSLYDWRNELIESYSHRMKQRLIISATLLHDPKVLVIDEPMVGLDPAGIRMIKNLFRDLAKKWKNALFHTALSWSGALTLIFVSTWISGAIYFKGLSKSQTSAGKLFSFTGWRRFGYDSLLKRLSRPARAFIEKEIKTFFRDQTQWSQIFLVMGLIVIYLYNFSVLPLERSAIKLEYLQNLLSFLNMGLAAFVLSAISARFVFPAVSLEGEAFWIVRASPLSIRTFLWIKFFVYFIPLLLLSELLVVLTNILLDVTPFMIVLSVLTVFLIVPGIVAMGIGLGAIYPDFKSESPTQSVTSLGGLIYMTLCMGFIAAVIIIEAGPVYSIFMTGIRRDGLTYFQWAWIVCSFAIVLGLCVAAVLIPMRRGEKKILQTE
ncbi:MAG: ATP-binding cassette domain-containing protein, partial [Thermodesulfobacteriota bacterium]|nr:ATP-binding cassette domain-containing protein [Thermodesulfobacteriota bacterium]